MKITPLLAGAMSGSIGGLTASRNRGGPYFRRRATPTNPNTPHQQAARSALGALVQSWSTVLDSTQRQAWKDYAQNTPRTNVIGQSLVLTGQQAFIGSNSSKAMGATLGLTPPNAGQFATVLDGPIIYNTGSPITGITAFTINFAGDEIVIDGELSTPADGRGIVFAFIGRPINPSVNFYGGPFTLAAVNEVTLAGTDCSITVDPADPTAWVWPSASDPQPVVAGGTYAVKLVVAYDDGRYSQPFVQILTCVGLPDPGP